MDPDLRALRDLGDRLRPPTDQAPDRLRQRVFGVAQARAVTTDAEHRPNRRWTNARWPTALVAAAGTALVILLAGNIAGTPAGTAPSEAATQSSDRILEYAGDRVAGIPEPMARRDQFVFSESVVEYFEMFPRNGGLENRDGGPYVVREWRPVDGGSDGVTLSRRLDEPDALWTEDVPAGCFEAFRNKRGEWLCGPRRAYDANPPSDADAMYDYLYERDGGAGQSGRTTDELAFDNAARALYLGQQSPAVQAAVFAAVRRIPGVKARDDAVDVAGRSGVSLVFKGMDGETELVFDSATYEYLGMNRTITTIPIVEKGDPDRAILLRQAVRRVAIVSTAGVLP